MDGDNVTTPGKSVIRRNVLEQDRIRQRALAPDPLGRCSSIEGLRKRISEHRTGPRRRKVCGRDRTSDFQGGKALHEGASSRLGLFFATHFHQGLPGARPRLSSQGGCGSEQRAAAAHPATVPGSASTPTAISRCRGGHHRQKPATGGGAAACRGRSGGGQIQACRAFNREIDSAFPHSPPINA